MVYSPKSQSFVPLTKRQWDVARWNRCAPFYASEWMPMYRPIYDRVVEQCVKEVKSEEYPSFLDICSGAGEPSLSLAKRFPGAEIVSADLAATNIRVGKLRASKAKASNVLFQYADAEDLQFDSDSFDVVVCCLGLMYCDVEVALEQMSRVAKSGSPVCVVLFGPLHQLDHIQPFKVVPLLKMYGSDVLSDGY